MRTSAVVLLTLSAAATAAAARIEARDGDVTPKGEIGDRLGRMVRNHLVATDVDYITAPFREKTERNGWWQTEFWGKYMHAAVPFWAVTRNAALKENVERGVAAILASQEPGGYIGNYPDDLRCGEGWDVWGMKYTMMGLLHYYDGMKASNPESAGKALAACRRLCDYAIGEIGPGGRRGREPWQTGYWSGFASSSILEPVVWLYRRTDEKRYLEFADFIVRGMTEPEAGPRLLDLALKGVSVADRNGYGHRPDAGGGYAMKHNRSKAYEMMSCYQGLLDYSEVTGRKDLFDAAVATCDQIIRDEINVAGGCASSEAWFHGAKKQHLPFVRLQETCVTTTWMRFLEKLFAMTGDVKYADELEKTFYNAYLASMNLAADEFAAYTPLNGTRSRGHHHCYMHTNCCNANGPRGFLAFLRAALQAEDDTAYLNFYFSGAESVRLPKSGRTVSFESYTTYPREGYVRLVNHTPGTAGFTLALRIPGWSAKTEVTVNGAPVSGAKAGSYLRLERTWRIGDRVEIRLDLATRVHALDHYVAFTRGPVALARDARFGDGALDEAFRLRSVDPARPPAFTPDRLPDDRFWMVFSAAMPIGSHYENPAEKPARTVRFCDYASAGDLWEPADHYRTWFPVEYDNGE